MGIKLELGPDGYHFVRVLLIFIPARCIHILIASSALEARNLG